jgi:hypothetical protein
MKNNDRLKGQDRLRQDRVAASSPPDLGMAEPAKERISINI